MDAPQHHAIDYIEFPVVDMAAAKRFYADAFGWEFTAYGDAYAGIRGEDREVGGLRLDAEVTRGGVLAVLFPPDVAGALAGVGAAGGVVTTAPFEFPGGRRFHFTDPSGNELAVWATS